MIQSEKILLRKYTQNDAQALALLANNKKIWDNIRDFIPFPYLLRDALQFIEFTQAATPPMTFAIEFEGKLCGTIGLVAQTDVYRLNAEIGYWIGEPFWHIGIATEAVKLMTNYGFRLGFVRIFAGVFEHNLASMKVLEKNGFQKECISPKAIVKNGKILDEHRFAKINPSFLGNPLF